MPEQKPEIWPVDDGFGVVGWGATCPKCDKSEMFISYWQEEWECPQCKTHYTFDDPEG